MKLVVFNLTEGIKCTMLTLNLRSTYENFWHWVSHVGLRRKTMKMFKFITSFAVSMLLPLSAFAAEKEPAEMYTYATYFTCDADKEAGVDDLIKNSYANFYNAAVKEGKIVSWGWLSHHSGGQWRRILYHTGPSIESLFTAQDFIGEQAEKELGTAADALSKGCPHHDDYVWQFVDGNGKIGEALKRGKAGMSVYFECSMTGDQRADEIVNKTFAPIYNEFIGEGKLTSWGWSSHVIGGKYRKLATMTAANYGDLLKARTAILEKIWDNGDNKESAEFNEICDSHQDYLWNIVHEKP